MDIAIKFAEIFNLVFDKTTQESVNFALMYCYNTKKKSNDLAPILEKMSRINETLELQKGIDQLESDVETEDDGN